MFTKVYESASGTTVNKLIVSVAAPYNDKSGQFRGALCGDITVDLLGERVKGIEYHGKGQGIIIGKAGSIIATAGSEQIMSDISDDPVLKDRARDILTNQDGYFTVEKDGEKQIFAYTTLPASDWRVGIYVPESFVFADLRTMKMTYGILFLIGILLVGFAGMQFSNRTTRTILRLKEHADELSQGNLQVEDLTVESADELGSLSKAFNTMSHNIRALIQKMAATAEQVAASSEELTASAQQSAEAANNVAGTIAEVAGGMEDQIRDIGDAKQDVDVVFTDITMVADKTKQVASTTAQTADAAQKGEALMVGAMSTMGSIEASVLDSAELVRKLGENSKQIGQIVDTIAAITDQTNLLALNAAIEAARAGEHGRGFAVVAEEVRKLAAESQVSAEEIKNRIAAIQADTEQVVMSMQSGTAEVQRGTEAIHEVGEQFTSIMGMVSEVKNQMDDIETAVQAVANGATNIVKAVDSIDEVSRTTAEHTQTISAATEEQSASTEEIASASQALAKLATDLQEATGKFRV